MAELTTTIYDLTVIGACPGGYEAALEAGKAWTSHRFD